MIKRAIVTGATGAIGTALINALIEDGTEVLVLARKNGRLDKIPTHPLVRIEFCALDEMREFAVQDSSYDAFFHLAWEGTYGKDRDNTTMQEQNIRYELDAVELAHRFGCKAFTSAGSQAENGRLPEGERVSPHSPERPETGYGIAKLAAGKLGYLRAKQLGIRYNRVRILSAYGPGDGCHTMVMSTILKFLKGEKAEFTKGEQLWDFIYNGDVAKAFISVAEKGLDGKTYPVGSGKAQPLKDYISIIRDTADPSAQCYFGAIDYFPNQVMYLCADITELTEDTGFTPAYTFEDGIKETVRWCKENYIK